jgi:hypothetical protein
LFGHEEASGERCWFHGQSGESRFVSEQNDSPVCSAPGSLSPRYYSFIRGLFNDAVSLGSVASNDMAINKLEGYESKQSWPNLSYYLGICL